MLQSLCIKNYALLSDVEIEFGDGLNILTGETGAGKSIVIGALGTILGERVDTTVLRQGASKAVIEGKFALNRNPQLHNYLLQQELSIDEDELILRREIYENSRSRAFVNDTPVPLAVLQRVSDLLVDLHGQHEHQSLLKVPHHLAFLDEFGSLERELKKVSEKYQILKVLHAELSELQRQQKESEDKREIHSFQIQEIEKVNPTVGEEEALLREEKIVQNSERLYSSSAEFFKILYENNHSAYDILSRVEQGLNELQSIDEDFALHKEECRTARVIIEELAKYFENYKSKLEFNPERLEELQRRISELSGLRKKFGKSIAEVLAFKEALKVALENFENLDERINSLTDEIESEKDDFSQLCLNLSQRRKQIAEQLERLLPEVLSYLGMSNARFKVAIKSQDDPSGWVRFQGKQYGANEVGMDFAQFLISTNKGENLRPLVKVVSGGEISRIMLALKSVIAKEGQIPILVFDEIDIGVSGRVAQAVGRKLKELSKYHQVICITHLPQIASLGDHHYSVEKLEKGGRTETAIRKLYREERAEEIAKLLAGEKISETHLNSARELLEDATIN